MPKYTRLAAAPAPAVSAGVASSAYPQHITEWSADGATYTSTDNISGVITYRPSYSLTPVPAGTGRA